MAQRGVNHKVCREVCNGLGLVIGHQEIRVNRPELFRHNGVHLLNMGLEIFLKDFKGGLLLELERLDGGHGT